MSDLSTATPRLPPDAVVIGGGPVGLCASLALARQGLRVQLVEAQHPGDGLDKACGEGLMPDALAALERVGVSLNDLGVPLHGIRYVDGSSNVAADFPASGGRGVRRLELHQRLARAVTKEHAIDRLTGWRAAIEMADSEDRPGVSAVVPRYEVTLRRTHCDGSVLPDSSDSSAQVDHPATRRLKPRWIVAADGLRSPSRVAAGLAVAASSHRFGARLHYQVRPWSQKVEVYWLAGLEAYVTPVGEQQVGLALLWDQRDAGRLKFEARLQQVWRRFPLLEQRLSTAPRSSAVRGMGPLRQPVRDVWRSNVALVGDASGYLDAITGEGLALGFADALAVAEAMRCGDLRLYGRSHRQRRRVPVALIHATLHMSRHPRSRRLILQLMQREPRLFARLLGLHVGATTPTRALVAVCGLAIRSVFAPRRVLTN